MDEGFITRVLSAIVGIILLWFIINRGEAIFLSFIVLMSAVANWELHRAFKKSGKDPNIIYSTLTGTLLMVTVYFLPNVNTIFLPFLIIIILSFFSNMVNYDRNRMEDIVYTIFSFVYTFIPFTHIILIRNLQYGVAFVWWVFVTTWSCDTFAYIIGMLIGSRKLAPDISPNKSIEGSIGGIFGSIAASFLFARYALPQISASDAVIVGLLVGIFSQIGDLSASLIKRFCKIKDFSNLIPGHGGVLDRFDSALFSFPVAYYYIIIAIQKGGFHWV
ncbi:phosphatidate cytidylyltransferase [Thermosediminibacter oceani]|uniref:Phosphatidate cytidylyltransferase n=1 Tax=Thermosediminibacter oceani (strain ATCC BAA-1034 / DSM 16646 / JW/IW-1228P) TaxID=555079 RepID=D9S3N1_THEOJ|nr:phosphatidate cytidylyltransferase [Thermosediminibacter oceani]ADL08008.1 phosphatidate cytidylyltransferase [Thermosediminibacter oceani DSM 16646]